MDTKIETSLPALLSADEIKLDQDSIKKTLTSLDQQVHMNAVQCLMHCEKHRDPSLMIRLLVEIIEKDKNGYRRQGLIAWMQYFSPMRLTKNAINLSGKDEHGKEQAFNVEKAMKTPFWVLTKEVAVIKPIYQQGVLAAINKAVKDLEESILNTDENGQPVDKARPFFKGKNQAVLLNFATEVKKLGASIPADLTLDIDKAQKKQAELAA